MKALSQFRTAIAVLVIFCGIEISHGQGASPQSELQTALMVVPNGTSLPTFEIELTNSGNHDLILNLGMMLANGRRQFADAIHLSLRDAQNNTEILELKGPPVIAGRIDPFVVPLPKGARMILPINLEDFWIPKQKVFEIKLGPGRYFLSADYEGKAADFVNLDMQATKLMPFWLGRVNSSEISFVVPEK